jgi:hypothetical protein
VKAVVVYESMYGNTHLVADAVAEGLRAETIGADADVVVVPVDRATPDALEDCALLVVGGPTHVHGMSRPSSRKAAIEAATTPDAHLDLDPDAEGPGLREWFDALVDTAPDAAAFDTRIPGPALVTGRASKGIARRLRDHGSTLVVEPKSFLVSKDNQLRPDEIEEARSWGVLLGRAMALRSPHAPEQSDGASSR